MMTPKVSVVVPSHNASRTLKSSLSALRSQDWPKEQLEIVYVDDASTDNSIEIASQFADHIVRLTGFPNGPAEARNAGARESSGDIVVFLDADVLAPPGTISALVKPLMEDENLDAIFGSYDSEPLEPALVSQYRNLLHHFVHQTSRRDASTFWAGCGAIRRRSFERTGGFDSKHYRSAMIEDIELGHRMRALGMRIRLQPSVQVKHLKRWTLAQMVRADIFSRGIPWIRLLFQDNRASGELGDLNLKVAGLLSVVLAWAGAIFTLLSLWFPKSLYGACLALGLLLVINFPVYRFFWQIRGLRFALMIIPLHVLYHLYNGASVIGGLLYRCFIDRPLPGLKSFGAGMQERYWHYLDNRRASTMVQATPAIAADRNWRSRLLPQLAIVLLAWVFLAGLHWRNDGMWFQGDSPRHAANGLFWKEFLLSGSLNPQDYALRYYARYPVISPTNYPPAFYILEGTLFAASGNPSPYTGKFLVLIFALLAACYLMAWLRRWVAVEAGWVAALLLLLPGFVRWSNVVMLNIPAAAISLAALYHARRWLEAPDKPAARRQLYLAAAFSLAAILTYLLAGVLVLILLAWVPALRQWGALKDRRAISVALIVAALLLPFLYVAVKWSPMYVGFVTQTAQDWTFYWKRLVNLAGPCLPVSALGLVIGAVSRRWRRETLLLLIFFFVNYVVFSVITAKDSRYGLPLCIPVVCFCAIAIQSFAEWLRERLKNREKLLNVAALAVVFFACGAQGWVAARTKVPRVQGIKEAVAFIEKIAPNEPVFYDGYYHNIFTFYVQAGDPEYKRQVVLGTKLLYASAINPMTNYQSFAGSSEEIIRILQTRCGCRWLAVEISEQSKQVPVSVLLRETVRGPQFELVRLFPVSGPGLDRIELYRFKLNPQPIDDADLPFPILGQDVRFKTQPIQR